MKILIVEDEPSLRELIQCSLDKERYVVETASDFNSALRKIEDYDYDCIYWTSCYRTEADLIFLND